MKTVHPNSHRQSSLQRWPVPLAVGATLVLFGLAWLLTGCVPTAVHPLYNAADVVQDPTLLGVWQDKPDGKESWTFTARESKGYNLVIRSDDQEAVFVAHLFKLGNERFLDLYPELSALTKKLEQNPYNGALIPGHLFFRVRATEPKLRLSSMGLEWLTQQLKRDPKLIAHVLLPEDRVVLTAGTDALQAFLKQQASNAEAWNDMYDDGLVKVPSKPADK